MTTPLVALPSGLFRANSLRSPALRSHAPRPALGMKTGISPALLYPGLTENQGLAVAADGSIWTLTRDSVSQFSHSKGELVRLCSYALYKQQPFGFPQHLAPVNFQHAFFIRSKDNRPVIMEFDKAVIKEPESVRALAALPDNDVPTTITASADGNMWVLARSGHVWRYLNNTWNKISTPAGTTILQISAGNADFLLALARQNGLEMVLHLQNGVWVKYNELMHLGIRWIGACEDGEYWCSSASLQSEGELHLIRAGASVQKFALGRGTVGLAAATARSCYFFALEKMCFQRAAIGVIDQPAQAWPAMTDAQTEIYGYLSAKLGITDVDGLRSQYSNINAPFSIWSGNLDKVKCPSTFTEGDWDIVKQQLLDELEYVQGVTTLSTNIALLNRLMGEIYTNTYNQVVQMLGLPAESIDQPTTLVELLLTTLVDKLEAAVISKAKSVVTSEAVDITIACYKYANAELNKKHNLPDGSLPLIIACSELAGTLTELTVKSEKARGEFQSAILKDWGRLSACGAAISSGVWFWSPGTSYEKIKDAGDAIRLNFYQTLMPVKWKIVLCEAVQAASLPSDPFMHHVPRYALMCKTLEGVGNSIYWWYACLEVGAELKQQTKGPAPNQKLLEAIFALETTPTDFFSGANGWKLSTAPVPGYRPPEPAAQWKPYLNLPGPFSVY